MNYILIISVIAFCFDTLICNYFNSEGIDYLSV